MNPAEWVTARGGIVHRGDLLDAGFSARRLRECVNRGLLHRVRRYWLRTRAAPAELVEAAAHKARLACVSAARHRRWWMPESAGSGIHLHVQPHAAAPTREDVTCHWSRPLVPVSARTLVESVEDTLLHVAACLSAEDARVVWESAIRNEKLTRAALLRVKWTTSAARDLAQTVSALSDSGLETIFVARLGPWGLPIRQQVWIVGHPVDVLLGERLVVQLDGFEFHSSHADRARDVAHDRALAALGFTVLRFTYAEVVHSWPTVERAIARAIAQGAHLAR
jgi:very-short-patch-repair endonuclease